MKKKNLSRMNGGFMNLDEYRKFITESRKDSAIWNKMILHPTKTFLEINNDYERIQSYINIAYILSDVQETCFLDLKDTLKKYNLKFSGEAKHNFNALKKAIQTAQYHIRENRRRTMEADESQNFIAGMSDVYYDTCRMLIDRLNNKRKVIRFFHLLKTIPNYNEIFTELDHGRYIFNKY